MWANMKHIIFIFFEVSKMSGKKKGMGAIIFTSEMFVGYFEIVGNN